jgi:hypothetical protein
MQERVAVLKSRIASVTIKHPAVTLSGFYEQKFLIAGGSKRLRGKAHEGR